MDFKNFIEHAHSEVEGAKAKIEKLRLTQLQNHTLRTNEQGEIETIEEYAARIGAVYCALAEELVSQTVRLDMWRRVLVMAKVGEKDPIACKNKIITYLKASLPSYGESPSTDQIVNALAFDRAQRATSILEVLLEY